MPPKRKNEAPTTPKPAKKAKTGATPTRTSPRSKKDGSETPPSNSPVRKPRKPAHPGSKAVKAPDEDANFEWEILDGDERSTLVVGKDQANRLTLTFHHRHDRNEKDRVFTYERREATDIDWNSKDHIRDINKWRNQIFVQNMKFPPKVTHTPWTPFETAYLELFHEKLLEAATGKTDTFVAPHNELIYKAFNDYFEDRTDIRDKNGKPIEEGLGTRPPGGLNSYLNRADTKVRGLRDRMKALEPKLKKSKKDDTWMPTITDDEIEQYIKGEWESAVDTTAAGDEGGEEDVDQAEEEDEAQAEGEGEGEDEDQAEDEDDGNDSDTSTLTTPPDTDEELESMEILEREQQAKRLIVKLKLKPSTASKFPGGKRPTTKPTVTKPTVTKPTVTKPTVTKPTTTKPTTSNPAPNTRSTSKATSGRSSARSSSPPPPEKNTKKTSSAKKTMTDPRKTTEAPEPKSKPRVVKPVETEPIPTHPDVIADLKAKGYTWTELPKNNEEAIKAHQEAQNAKPSENAWIEVTKKNLEDRIGRQTNEDFNREFFNKDLKEKYEGKGKMVNVEDWHEKSARRAGAAEVTALLNTADIPPLGYTGDIRDLHKKRLLSEDELELADAREAAIPRMQEAVERARQMKIKEESDKDPILKAKHDRAAAMQKDVAYDSDITTSGEDTDEEA
ncbi:uncharacterized protein J4E88_007119 [Alternaria novae-zelandiae]|uniref:uncharacterized protein n=1 Tax=Alternaria novae-zelandiae TaxID=430562 RepID=UPI0020C532B0|nr:uncharacterized protein J4E88_007119 [Alternaria novae-zelandiae]KAI4677311.1 hypothetical protein J4E88_007119 [Alternaria novae-zelandiae]